jgi:uncharacterized protein with PIN domain
MNPNVDYGIGSDLHRLRLIEPNGKCPYCNTQLKIHKEDHNFIRTKGYTKYYGGMEAVIRCPKCKRELIVTLK